MNKGIQTMFKGIRFKSRPEGRWAATCEGLGWQWQYEVL